MRSYYPKSKVEISGFRAKHYDRLMSIITLGMYSSLMQKAVRLMEIKRTDKILDLGTGTGSNACLMNQTTTIVFVVAQFIPLRIIII